MSDTGYIYAVICAVMQSMDTIMMGVCLERLLTPRADRLSKRKRLVIWSVCSCVILWIKCTTAMTALYISVGTPVAISLLFIFFLRYCYSNTGRIKLVHAAMLVLQGALADVVYEVVWGRPPVELWDIPFRTRGMAEVCTIIAALSIMAHILYTVLVLRIRKKKKAKVSSMWIAIMLLFMLMFVAIRVMQDIQIPGKSVGSYFVFICVFAVLEFSTLMLYLSQSEKREAQEEKQKAQEEVSKLQQAMELEKVHYEQIEARREEMAKIRHDYNNVITSVMLLIENGKTDEAGDVIKDLSERISKTREYPFCGIPIINAVLTEKKKECEAEGITLTVDLLIPEHVTVADLDLCMIFGNLMDNAIRSGRELRELGKDCGIILSGGMAQDYLIVKCRNASLENREKKIKGTGYGHKILEDIARKYNGDFQTAYEEGIFMAQISLGVKVYE